MGTVVVVGSAVIDLVAYVPRFGKPGETITGGRFEQFPGGKGANQAVAAARLGAQTSFCGCVGQDSFGDQLLENLGIEGVDTSLSTRSPDLASGVALIAIDRSAQNQINVCPGANMSLSAKALQPLENLRPDVLITQLEIPLDTVWAALQIPSRFKILNPAPARQLPHAFLHQVDLVTPNESEAEELTGIEVIDFATADLAAKQLLQMGAKAVLVTLGSQGCYLTDGVKSQKIPVHPVVAVDTVGAGDALNGALAALIAAGRPLPSAVQMANVAAALSVTKSGAQGGMPTMTELELALLG